MSPNNAPRSTFTTSPAVQETMKSFPATQQIGFQFNPSRQATKEGVTPSKKPPTAQTGGTQGDIAADFASNTVEGPPSIVELSRALNVDSNGPQYMFEYVYNNIDWEPGWGVQKGALATICDGMGNAFDQSLLLANLLRQAGYTANIVMGTIRLLDTQYEAWWNVPDIWGAQSYCLNEYIPIVTAPTWNGTQYYMDIRHVWVEWVDGSTTYYFDPCMKTYSRKTGLSASSLASALGYVSSTFLSDAESGATIDGSGNYVQNMNRTNIRADLQTYTANLVSYIGSNTIGSAPAGTATVDDVLGGQTIVPVTLPVLNTSLGYEAPGDTPTVWTGDVPSTYKPTLQVQFPNWSNPNVWDFTWSTTSDLLACTRLTLWYSGTLVPSLYLNGTAVATGLAQPSGTYTSLYLTLEHPAYAASNYPLSYQQYYQSTWTWWQSNIYAGDYYLVGNAWGNLGRGQLDYHQTQAAAAIAAGDSSTSEALLGEQLAITFFQWAGQNSRVCDLVNRIMSCKTMYSHQVGMISFNDGGSNAQTTDLGGVSGSSDYLPNLSDYATETSINDTVIAMHGVALEAATCAQMNGITPGIATTSVLDRANRTAVATIGGTITAGNVLTIVVHDTALSGGTKSDSYTVVGTDTLTTIATALASAINSDASLAAIGVTATSSGALVFLSSMSANQTSYTSSTSGGATETITIAFEKIYQTTTANWTAGIDVESILVANGYNSSDMTNLYNSYITYGDTVVIADHPGTTLGSWTGWGYWAYPASGAYGNCNGVMKFGGSQPGGPGTGTPNPNGPNPGIPPTSPEPISMFTGDYLYNREDVTVGSQNYPYKLTFERQYTSKAQYITSTMGRGWSHNHLITAAMGSDGLLAMGGQFAAQGASSIAELYIATDIFSDTTRPIAKLVIASLGDAWWIDQIVNNTVIVTNGNSSFTFVKQPDGSYTPPASYPSQLTLSSGAYSLLTPQGLQTTFNTSGQVETIITPAGVAISYSYSGGVLSTISNGLNRTLTLHYSSGLLTSITDGTGRSIQFGYDSNKNLTTYIDTTSNTFSYNYDQPGRLTQWFKPQNPTTACVTNVYDSLSRVKTQSNALSQTWTYYFAGSRSQEVDPVGNVHAYYFDQFGGTLRDINALGFQMTNEYDGLHRVVQTTFPEANQLLKTYDSNNNVLESTFVPKPGSGLTSVTSNMSYDPTWAKIKTYQDGNGNTITYSYDPTTGNLLSIAFPVVGGMTPTITMTYNSRGQLQTRTDQTDIVSKFTYDSSTEELLTLTVDYGTTPHLNLETQYGYDSVGNLNSITDPNSNTTTYVCDTERRITQITLPSPFSYATAFGYDANGNLLTVSRQTGNADFPWQTYTWTYSVTDKKKTMTDPSGYLTTWNYDLKDRLENVIDPMSREYQLTYDGLDRLYQVTDPTLTISETRSYTNNGHLASIKDAQSNSTQYTYDGHDRQDKTIYADASFEQNQSYDSNGNILTYSSRSGGTVVKTFDVLNRVSTKAPSGEATVTYGYDLANRLTSVSKPVVAGDPSTGTFQRFFDTAGRFYQEEYPDGKTVTFQLDANENVTQVTYPDGYYVTRDFDQLNRIVDIKLNGSATQAVVFSYDELSRRTTLTFSNAASVSYSYGSPIVDDLVSITHTFVGASTNLTYAYNNVHEVTMAGVTDPTYVWHPSASGTTTYGSANNVNQYPTVGTKSYSYDGNGNLANDSVWSYVFDTENHLTSVSQTGTSISYLYDPFERQAQKSVTTTGTSKTRYVYSKWQRVADYDGTSGALQNRYVFGIDEDEPILQVSSAGVITFYHANYQGSIVAISNASGAVVSKNVYGTFGETTSISGTTFGFSAQRYDSETGLYYYKSRYYDPSIGRFMEPDSTGFDVERNLYSYASNDPINFTDPRGFTAAAISDDGFDIDVQIKQKPIQIYIPGPHQGAPTVAGTNCAPQPVNTKANCTGRPECGQTLLTEAVCDTLVFCKPTEGTCDPTCAGTCSCQTCETCGAACPGPDTGSTCQGCATGPACQIQINTALCPSQMSPCVYTDVCVSNACPPPSQPDCTPPTPTSPCPSNPCKFA